MSVGMKSCQRSFYAALVAACLAWGGNGGGAQQAIAQTNDGNTNTPIKHLIVVIGENHGFDNVFATYVPPDYPPGVKQTVWNLLSQGIVDKSGHPGAMAAKAMQRQAIDEVTYQLAPSKAGTPSYLPQPSTTLNALPASPCYLSTLLKELYPKEDDPALITFCSDIGLLPADQNLLNEGGTGQSLYFMLPASGSAAAGTRLIPLSIPYFPVPDCRYPSNLPNAPYSVVGASQLNNCPSAIFKDAITPTAYSDNVGDPVHRFYQMWQQNDCSRSAASPENPSGCLHDLYVWVATTVGWQITKYGTPPTDNEGTFQGGVEMGFYNMAAGDYPYFQWLAQNNAISDNYHQPLMGGTGPNSQFLMTGDVFYYTDSNGNAATPPAKLIENPNPQAGSNNFYTQDSPGSPDLGNTSTGGLVNCADATQPGVVAVLNYLNSLHYRPFNNGNCERGHFYYVDNEYPYYGHLGNVIQTQGGNEFEGGSAFAIGPQTIPTIGDSLSAANVSWKYYGEGFDQAAEPELANELYCAICNGFQYSRSIMTSTLKNNLQDLPAFFSDVSSSKLPAVSFVKPDVLTDSHPGTSTPPLFEAFVKNIIQAVQQNQTLWQNTAILITFDESGGYYDSGYIQPIDFFGDGPRTVLIAVSPFVKTGFVDHTYADHASILKFIERNWNLKPLSSRSRDNLPNPIALPWAPYFPINSPAIGDLMGMFTFGGKGKDF